MMRKKKVGHFKNLILIVQGVFVAIKIKIFAPMLLFEVKTISLSLA